MCPGTRGPGAPATLQRCRSLSGVSLSSVAQPRWQLAGAARATCESTRVRYPVNSAKPLARQLPTPECEGNHLLWNGALSLSVGSPTSAWQVPLPARESSACARARVPTVRPWAKRMRRSRGRGLVTRATRVVHLQAHRGSRGWEGAVSRLRGALHTCTHWRMSPSAARAPRPTSLQASVLDAGGMMWKPQDCSVSRCSFVAGCSHMTVFMAGATMSGFAGSHARRQHVAKLSLIPLANLARVLAEHGATTPRSAHRRSSMCSTKSFRMSR